jgi:hypothetical protein
MTRILQARIKEDEEMVLKIGSLKFATCQP